MASARAVGLSGSTSRPFHSCCTISLTTAGRSDTGQPATWLPGSQPKLSYAWDTPGSRGAHKLTLLPRPPDQQHQALQAAVLRQIASRCRLPWGFAGKQDVVGGFLKHERHSTSERVVPLRSFNCPGRARAATSTRCRRLLVGYRFDIGHVHPQRTISIFPLFRSRLARPPRAERGNQAVGGRRGSAYRILPFERGFLPRALISSLTRRAGV